MIGYRCRFSERGDELTVAIAYNNQLSAVECSSCVDLGCFLDYLCNQSPTGTGASAAAASTAQRSRNGVDNYNGLKNRSLPNSATGSSAGGALSNKKKTTTVATEFRSSLNELMNSLRNTTPHFIRCIKPNQQKQTKFDSSYVLPQLRCATSP